MGELETNKQSKGLVKVLMLTWEFPPNIIGGLAKHVHGLSKGLVEDDSLAVYVLTAKRGDDPEYEQVDGVHVYRVSPLHEQEPNFLTWIAGLNLALMSKAFELHSQHQFNLVHAHDWLVGTAALMMKVTFNIPLIATIHSTEHGRNQGIFTNTQNFIHEKEQQLISGANQIIVCSQYMKNELKKVFRINTKNIAVIANGVDIPSKQDIQDDDDSDLPIVSGKKLIFSLGRMVPEKGFETIIDAAPKLLEREKDICFIIGGIGPKRDEYQQMIVDRGLADNVFLIGFVGDAKKSLLFHLCEAAIFPSLYEPFGIVALESMASGTPTIVSKTGGLTGIIDHMQTGLFITPGDQNSLIEQIQFVLHERELAVKIGIAGRKKVQRLFSWGKIATKTKTIYEHVLLKHDSITEKENTSKTY